jgi:hypothetical protein
MIANPFTSLETYIGLGRVGSLVLAPDGESAVLTVTTLSRDRTRFVNSLWTVPTRGDGVPRRLTTQVSGAAAFIAGGDILFVSDRAGEDADDDAPEHAQLWRLPRGGGEARPLTALPGGVSSVAAVAADAERVVLAAELMHGAGSLDDDARLRAARGRRKVAAILHETYPVRDWDPAPPPPPPPPPPPAPPPARRGPPPRSTPTRPRELRSGSPPPTRRRPAPSRPPRTPNICPHHGTSPPTPVAAPTSPARCSHPTAPR